MENWKKSNDVDISVRWAILAHFEGNEIVWWAPTRLVLTPRGHNWFNVENDQVVTESHTHYLVMNDFQTMMDYIKQDEME